MTAEIALLNKMAVTLAADSAVTIGGSKVYNSADKIFEGTNHDPIGVMVYNSPELGGIPVETIIKMYRDRQCNQQFSTVFDYAAAFLNHVESIDTPELTISSKIRALIAQRAFELQRRVQVFVNDFLRNAGAAEQTTPIDEVLEALETEVIGLLDAEIVELALAPSATWAGDLTDQDVLEAHGLAIAEFVNLVFENDHLTTEQSAKVATVLAWSLLKEFQRGEVTGLVFAGFGRDEIFPSLIAFEVYGTIAGKLKYVELTKFDVDRQLIPDAAVIPFAQKEMVDRFMYGLDGDFLDLCRTYFGGALATLKENLDAILADVPGGVTAPIAPAIDTIIDDFNGRVVPDHLKRLRSDFSDMVRSMPKQELAALSESLVHITSLKRKFSAGAESVGGPIDVAMITRAEGFVWVKRKHYFDPSLNPRYFARRYGRATEGGANQPAAPETAE